MSTTFNEFHYFATTSTLDQKLTPYPGDDTHQPTPASSPVEILATPIAPQNNTNGGQWIRRVRMLGLHQR